MPILSIKNLSTKFSTHRGSVYAVNGVSFDVETGEIVGIVGESGSGKSVLCQSIMGLTPRPAAQISCDSLIFCGIAVPRENEAAMRRIRGSGMSMVFQDPLTALNPYLRVGYQLTEALTLHTRVSGNEARQRATDLLTAVGIGDATHRIRQYPHEFSGGMRQRVCIAMALIAGPQLLFADEPTTALDVTIQAQILALLKNIRQDRNLSIVFITHDLGVVAGFCDRVMVMYAGRIVETAATANVFSTPRHPYTAALMKALPARARPGTALYSIPGQPPDGRELLTGCAFAPRCAYAQPLCATTPMTLTEAAPGHCTACMRVYTQDLHL